MKYAKRYQMQKRDTLRRFFRLSPECDTFVAVRLRFCVSGVNERWQNLPTPFFNLIVFWHVSSGIACSAMKNLLTLHFDWIYVGWSVFNLFNNNVLWWTFQSDL